MSEEKMHRLGQVARMLNVGLSTVTDHLGTKGFKVEANPNAKISNEQYSLLLKDFQSSIQDKKEASNVSIGKKHSENITLKAEAAAVTTKKKEEEQEVFIKNLEDSKQTTAKPVVKEEEKASVEETKVVLPGFKVVGKIDLDAQKKPVAKPAAEEPKVVAVVAPEPPKEKPVAIVQPKEETAKPVVAEKPAQETPVQETKKEEVKAPVAETPKTVVHAEKPKQPQQQAQQPTAEKPKVEPEKPKAPVAEKPKPVEAKPVVEEKQEAPVADEVIEAKADTLKGLTVLGKIQLPVKDTRPAPGKKFEGGADKKKKKRARIPGDTKVDTNRPAGQGGQPGQGQNHGPRPQGQGNGPRPQGQGGQQGGNNRPGGPGGNRPGGNNPGGNRPAGGGDFKRHANAGAKFEPKGEISDKEIQDKIKATMAKLQGGHKPSGNMANRSKYRKEKRNAAAEALEDRLNQEREDAKVLKVNEFCSTSDLASLMDVSVNDVIKSCLNMGLFVSINQRLDAEVITVIADEFGFDAQFISVKEEEEEVVEVEAEEDLLPRSPIVTIMGHVDHGKTSLLDYIRRANVTASEAGGITQHIGAYDVTTEGGKKITFLDTPGHEAFTAMRARGAKITDIVIIVVAADDSVMPQTKEAINHAQNAGVPIVFAINKIDKPGANSDKIREQLSQQNILLESWGGKFQEQEISAKKGTGIKELLEKVLLEAELLDLKANPNKNAVGAVIEASLDKGRGYVSTLIVQSGTLRVGDIVLAGTHFGKVRAMTDHKGTRLKTAGPSCPVQVLGLAGAPQAGDKFQVMESDREAREIATRREQLIREQSVRTKKHITLDEIGRRLAIGTFKQLNVIVKGDVDGSVEALSDSLLKLSTEEIQVSIIHKGVGQISESDILLASASDAIVIAFQVRPSQSAKKLAEQEEIEIRMYSIIYDAINDLKAAMEGMLEPKFEEIIVGNIDIREVFKISKVGTVAGCYVTEGYVKRNNQIRVIRDGIVVYSGELQALKRFKDDVAEVKFGYECGLSIKNFNNLEVGDTIESYEQREVKRKL